MPGDPYGLDKLLVPDSKDVSGAKQGDVYLHPPLPQPAIGTEDPGIRNITDRIHNAIASPMPGFSPGMRKTAQEALKREAFYNQLDSNQSRGGMQGAIDSMLAANNGPSMAALQRQQAMEQNMGAFGATRGNAGFQSGMGQLGQANSGIAGDAGRAQMAEMYGNLNGAAAGTNAMRAQDIQQAQAVARAQLGQKSRNLQRYQESSKLGVGAAENDRQANIEGLRIYQTAYADQNKKNADDAQRAFDTTATVLQTIGTFLL